MSENILEVRDLVKVYGRGKSQIHAVDHVSFDVREGTTLGIVGESGSGKSTTGSCILQLTHPTSGSVKLKGKELVGLRGKALREVRKAAQMVFQDPYESLDPRMTVEQIIAEPLFVHGIGSKIERRFRVEELLEQVGLDASDRTRYPSSFSGGQRQRIGIARALALRPQLLIFDESVSALDVSVQAQIINLIRDLQKELGLTYLWISHDLAVVRAVADDILVMHTGKIEEFGESDAVFTDPQSEYTRSLIATVPSSTAALA